MKINKPELKTKLAKITACINSLKKIESTLNIEIDCIHYKNDTLNFYMFGQPRLTIDQQGIVYRGGKPVLKDCEDTFYAIVTALNLFRLTATTNIDIAYYITKIQSLLDQ